MIKIDMVMPECCIKCPFFRGSYGGGSCAVDIWGDMFFNGTYPDIDRHKGCPLQEEEDD